MQMKEWPMDDRFTYRIDPDKWVRLTAVAEKTGLSRSEIARRCLYEMLPRFERLRMPGASEKSKLVKDEGEPSKNYSTALEHLSTARSKWVRRFWLDNERQHVKRVADLPDLPAWPENLTLQDVLVAGFGSRIIVAEDDAVLKALRGEAHD